MFNKIVNMISLRGGVNFPKNLSKTSLKRFWSFSEISLKFHKNLTKFYWIKKNGDSKGG